MESSELPKKSATQLLEELANIHMCTFDGYSRKKSKYFNEYRSSGDMTDANIESSIETAVIRQAITDHKRMSIKIDAIAEASTNYATLDSTTNQNVTRGIIPKYLAYALNIRKISETEIEKIIPFYNINTNKEFLERYFEKDLISDSRQKLLNPQKVSFFIE